MPCFVKLAERIGVKLPSEERFLEWFEEKLKEVLGVLSHKELEKALNDKYLRDNRSLKLLFEELLAAYRLRLERKNKAKILVEEGVV
ncbi:MAG: hypothetical protein ACKD6N_03040 [Candidatus Bathyarchaeota archaeon]